MSFFIQPKLNLLPGLIIFCLMNISFANTTAAQSQKPNIIFILGDDIGYKTLPVNGGQSYNTPNIDSMVKQGMNFNECHASPLCSPSRVMLLTGKYNFRNYTAWGIMDTTQKTIANMFKNAGYATGCFGKWQLDGGETSIKKFGFDDYCVWLPFNGEETSRYKDPVLFTNNAYIPDSIVHDEYGEDIVADSLMNFIERNKSVPFFIYYPMLLAHPPFQPTPDDTAYASWIPSAIKSDTSFYTSMIEYMDKKIGQVLNKVKQLGLSNNTVIIYTGDNGTPAQITLQADGGSVVGGKDSTTEAGTHVPLIIDWPAVIKEGFVNNDLIGFTDFLPTLAHISNIAIPANYGPLDGVDFYPRLNGNPGTPRDWLFYDFDAHPGIDSLKRWAQTKEYKLYDTSLFNSNRPFYNIINDPDELDSITHDNLTTQELSIKQELLQVINSYVKQGVPIIGTADLINITDSSVTLEDSIQTNGGSTVKTIGAVWDQNANPIYPTSSHTNNGTITGPFQTTINGLKTNSVYYVRTYAKNFAGISYSNQIKFRTLLHAPLAYAATSVDNANFVAHWHSVNAANRYKLYVSLKPGFVNIKPGTIDQQFNKGITPPTDWTFTGSIGENDTVHGALSPAVQFKAPKAQIITNQFSGAANQLKFWIKGLSTDTLSYFLVEGFNGKKWVLVKLIQPISSNGITKTFDSSSGNPLPENITQFRFTYYKSKGTLAFDNVYIKYNTITNSFVSGYNGLNVNDTLAPVSGLKAGTTYYYEVKAISSNNTSGNSNTVSVTTCASPDCNQSIVASKINTGLDDLSVFPNPSSKDFTLIINNNKPADIIITNSVGNVVYRLQNARNNKLVFGTSFTPGLYSLHVQQQNNSTFVKLIKMK